MVFLKLQVNCLFGNFFFFFFFFIFFFFYSLLIFIIYFIYLLCLLYFRNYNINKKSEKLIEIQLPNNGGNLVENTKNFKRIVSNNKNYGFIIDKDNNLFGVSIFNKFFY